MVGKRAQTPVSKRWPGCLDVERISPETRDQRRIFLCEDGVYHAGDAKELLPPRRRVWLEPVDADDVSEACLRRGSKGWHWECSSEARARPVARAQATWTTV